MENQQNVLDAPFPESNENPKEDFLKGILYTFIFYSAGLGLAALAYGIVGHPYIHAPGLHHWLIFLTFLGSLLWALIALVQYFSGTRTWKLKGIMLANSVGVLLFVVTFHYAIVHEEEEGISEVKEEMRMLQNGDTYCITTTISSILK